MPKSKPPSDEKQRRETAGKFLKGIREAKGVTQRQVAEAVGIEVYTVISQYEAGHGKLPTDIWPAYAEAIGMQQEFFAKKLLEAYMPEIFSMLYINTGDFR